MFELVKIVWDLIVIRDATRKGQLNWRIWVIGIGFVLFLYGTGLPASMLYDQYPQYKPVFIAVMVLDGIVFVGFIIWAWRWQAGNLRRENPASRRLPSEPDLPNNNYLRKRRIYVIDSSGTCSEQHSHLHFV